MEQFGTAFQSDTDYRLVTESLNWNRIALSLKDWYQNITTCGACNWQCYLDRYGDLKAAAKNADWTADKLGWAKRHYENYGSKENRECACPADVCHDADGDLRARSRSD